MFKTEYRIRCIDFSPDGLMIAIGTNDGEVVLYKTSNNYENLDKLDSNRQRKACITDIK
jgi:WD40 repeat protein